MKSIYLTTLVIILVIYTRTDAQPCSYRNNLNDKICIDFDKDREEYFINQREVEEKKSNYKNNFRIRNSHNTGKLYEDDTVIMEHLVNLYGIVDTYSQENYLTGIKITYGLLESGKMIRLYQPWYIKDVTFDHKEVTGNVRYVNRQIYYTYVADSGFAEYSADNVQKVIDNLLDNMEIRPTRNGNFRAPHYTSDWTSDTESSFYSFQELFYLYNLNYENSECNNYACGLIVSEGASYQSKNIFWKKRYKMATMFTAIKGIRKETDPEKGDVANLGHLCPPKCNDLTYPIE